MSVLREAPKRLFLGRPMRSSQLSETLLPKKLAMPVFCSDPLSSVAYATEEILLILSLGGLAFLHLAWYVAAVIVALLAVVIASYRQTCRAYPNGGGAYTVARANLGESAGLAAASALLVDYVLTVAVSVVAGVAAITSAVPELSRHAVSLSVGFVVLLTVMNLRGVKESGKAFAVPTYGFLLGIYVMFAVAAYRLLSGEHLLAPTAGLPIYPEHSYVGLAVMLLAMRAFASGCTALTGVEAISNGVPAFQKPKAKNAADTLAIMGFFSITMFIGITVLALTLHVHVAESPTDLGLPADTPTQTALAQIAQTVFGIGPLFYYLQAATAAILILAANTAFNGFPLLASLLATDRFLPRQLHNRGDRLVYSNGIILLALFAIALIVAFNANVSSIIQLYIIGVFVSFTLSQLGMVRHWQRELTSGTSSSSRTRIRRSQAINAIGATFTAIVLIIVLITKFTHGAWIVTIAMPLLFVTMQGIRRHYRRVTAELTPTPAGVSLPSRIHAIVPVSRLAPAHPASPRLRARHPPQHIDRAHRSGRRARNPGARRRMARTRDSRRAENHQLALPRDHHPDPRLHPRHSPGQPPRRHLRIHPRIPRWPLVGTPAAQPKRTTPESTTPLHPRRHGRQRPLPPEQLTQPRHQRRTVLQCHPISEATRHQQRQSQDQNVTIIR